MNIHLISIFSFWIVTFLVWIIIIPIFIKYILKYKLWKQIRKNATIWKATEFAKLHKKKTWTPSMWWVVIILIIILMIIVSILLQKFWFINNTLLNRQETYLPLFTLLTIWALWLIDDYLNIKWIWRTKWISVKIKIIWLLIFSALWAFWFYFKLNLQDYILILPFLENGLYLWYYFIPLFIIVIISSANSVNITDWLDWLAWWLLLFCYSIYTYITYDQWLFLLSTLCISIVWTLIAFLWFNIKPAKLYLWDVWSLSLWATLWILAIITNTIFILFIIWAIFILETISVIIQLTSKKLRNWKKIFKIAPFHHHLEAIWWAEETVVFRMWLIWMISSVIAIIFYIIQK